MTEIELKDYLTQYRNKKEGNQIYIDALTRYRQTLETFPPYIAKEYIKDIDDRIKTSSDDIRKQDGIVLAWSELISNYNARQIFIDHYINGMDWDTIEDAQHYARSTVYGYHKKALTEITQKAVQDIADNSTITAISI